MGELLIIIGMCYVIYELYLHFKPEKEEKKEYCLIWETKNNQYLYVQSPWGDEELKEIGFEVKARFKTKMEVIAAHQKAKDIKDNESIKTCTCAICENYDHQRWATIMECPCHCHTSPFINGHESLCCEFVNGKKKDNKYETLEPASYYRERGINKNEL